MIVSFSIAGRRASAGKYWGLVAFDYFRFYRRGFFDSEPLRANIGGWSHSIISVSLAEVFSAGSPCGRVGWRGREPLLASIWGNGCMIAFVSTAEDLSAVSHCGQVGWRECVKFRFSRRETSWLTLEMTLCPIRGVAVGRAGRPRPAA